MAASYEESGLLAISYPELRLTKAYMVYQRIHKSSSWNPPSQEKSSQFTPRPFAVQAQQDSHEPPTQQEIENEAFNQNKFEAFGLQLKEKSGTITPIEQERLGVLQAKKNDFWAQRLERASRFGHNFANIPVHAPGQQVSAPIQPRPAIQRYRADVPLRSLQPAIASKLVEDGATQATGNTAGNRPDSSVEQRPNTTGMPDALKAGVESLSGYSLDDVRVHYNSPKPVQLQALAYTQGTEIHVAPGEEKHLPHEAWHVVQQKQGRVQPTLQAKGKLLNDDTGLEYEADVMGGKLVATAEEHTATDRDSLDQPMTVANLTGKAGNVIQRVISHDPPVFTGDAGRAGGVRVENIKGTTYPAAHNSPSVNPIGWPELKNAGHTLSNRTGNNSHYNAVRMHLWNGRLDGPGNDILNLAPGPATVNSQMSAGPEIEAKDAVDDGDSIWLETKVTYANNTVNAHVFTSVIPNHIDMKWGYMQIDDTSGPAKSTWNTAIDQPAGALTALELAPFLAATTTTALDLLLVPTVSQVKAQIFAALPDGPMKTHMLLNYPDIYNGMPDSERETALSGLTAAQIHQFTTLTLGLTRISDFISQVLQNLYLQWPLIEATFNQFTSADQISLAIFNDGEMLDHLGVTGTNLAKTNRRVFNALAPGGQFALLDTMSKGEITVLMNSTAEKKLFDAWAISRRAASLAERKAFIQERVETRMANAYDHLNRWEQSQVDRDANPDVRRLPDRGAKRK